MENILDIPYQEGKQIYFASDIHFGEPNYETSRARERKVLRWIKSIEADAQAIFLVGDVFDFWFEYKHVVPKGYIRFFGKIAELVENGIEVYVFTGNHDLWMNDYLEKELGVTIFRDRVVVKCNGKKFFVAHGDGLGPNDTKYKLLKKVFTNPVCKWLFRWVHPDIGIKIANLWSRRSRIGHNLEENKHLRDEWLSLYAQRKLETAHYDYFIFGHRHIPLEHQLNEKSTYINLGDWIENDTYAAFNGKDLELKYYRPA